MTGNTTDEERLIWAMADAHWAVATGGDIPFREIPTLARELYFDAMHVALRQLIPTLAMVDAAIEPVTARERAQAVVNPRSEPLRRLDRVIQAQRFAAMLDRLLHIEGKTDAHHHD